MFTCQPDSTTHSMTYRCSVAGSFRVEMEIALHYYNPTLPGQTSWLCAPYLAIAGTWWVNSACWMHCRFSSCWDGGKESLPANGEELFQMMGDSIIPKAVFSLRFTAELLSRILLGTPSCLVFHSSRRKLSVWRAGRESAGEIFVP